MLMRQPSLNVSRQISNNLSHLLWRVTNIPWQDIRRQGQPSALESMCHMQKFDKKIPLGDFSEDCLCPLTLSNKFVTESPIPSYSL
jgi:hypothetical protein